ncbi:type VI secretion system contractile sheath small subunit [Ostreiculturibacter nitratireducens]|uniref:type VI secretion system contractile sheath small subunit n=1 Tax=Ostreiculturibacter nitratireducens TaxID=3075226 RepID=UPI003CCC7A14
MSGSQKFLSRNRAPRVQIEYDVELYGSIKKVQLPFVMGVMSDLSGKSPKPSVAERAFLEIDADNFDDRMRSVAPRAQFSVPNTLTGEGSLSVDLTFEKMSDFGPEALAARVDALRPLLEARTQLSNLMTYMDGKSGAEALIERILADRGLLKALAGTGEAAPDVAGVLSDLASQAPADVEGDDGGRDRTLSDLTAKGSPEVPSEPAVEDVLSALNQPESVEEDSSADDALAALRAAPVPEEEPDDESDGILSGLARQATAETGDVPAAAADILAGVPRTSGDVAEDKTDDTLSAVAPAPDEKPVGRSIEDVLSGIEATEIPSAEETQDDVLSRLQSAPQTDAGESDGVDDILKGLGPVDEAQGNPEDDLDDILAGIADPPAAETVGSSIDDVLSGIEASEVDVADDLNLSATDIGSVRETAPLQDRLADASDEDNDLDALPAGMDADAGGPAETEVAAAPDPEPEDDLDALLAGMDADAGGPAETEVAAAPEPEDDLDALLAGMDADAGGPAETEVASAPDPEPEDDLDALLAGMDADAGGPAETEVASAPDPEPEDDLDALLAGMDADAGGPAETEVASAPDPEPEDDLDALLAGMDADAGGPAETEVASAPDPEPEDDLDALLAGMDADAGGPAETEVAAAPEPEDDLDALLAGMDEDAGGPAETEVASAPEPEPEDDLDALLAGMDADAGGPAKVAAASPQERPQSGFGVLAAPRPSAEALDRKKFRMAIFGDFSGRSARGVIETGAALANRRAIKLDVDEIDEVIEGFGTTLMLPLAADGISVAVPLGELDDLHPDELFENVEIFAALAGLRQQLKTGSMAEKATERLLEWSRQYSTPVAVPRRSAATSVPADRRLSDFQALIGDTKAALSRSSPVDDLIARIVGPHIVKAPDSGVAPMLAAVDAALESAMCLVLHHPEFQAVEAQWRSLDLLARRIETDEKLEIVLFDVSAEELAVDLAAGSDLAQSGFFGLLNSALDPETGDGGFSALFGLYGFEETPPHAEILGRIAKVASFVDAPFFGAMSPAFLDVPMEERHPLVAQAWDRLRALPEAAYVGLASPRFLLRLPYGAKSEPISAFPFEEFNVRTGLSGMLWANPVVLVAILLAATFKKDGKSMSLGSLMTLGDMPFHYVSDRYGDQVALPCTDRNMTQDAAQQALARGYMPVLSPKGRNEVRLGSFRSLGGSEIAGPWGAAAPKPTGDGGGGGLSIEMEIAAPAEAAPDAEASLDELLAGFSGGPAPSDDGGAEDMDPELAALLEGL